jgi:uncharacterized integral membrane protein
MAVQPDPDEDQTSDSAPRRRRDLRLVVSGVLLALGVWFFFANSQDVRIRFWVFDTRTPIVVALGIAAVFGLGIGVLVGRRFHRSS